MNEREWTLYQLSYPKITKSVKQIMEGNVRFIISK